MEFEIKPESRLSLGLKELWDYRELFYFFTLRDIKVKYKQTVLGFLWAVLQPLLLTFIFTFFLGKAISNYTSLVLPYDIFALSGLVLWGIFSTGLNNAGNSMVTNAGIIRKIYFPRLIIPLSSVLVGLFDFIMAFAVFLVYCFARGQHLHASALLYFPVAVLLTSVATFGAGTLLAALNVKYRDFRYVIPFLVQFLLFVSPVIYPAQMASERHLGWLFALNPMSAPLDLFRCALTGSAPVLQMDLLSTGVGLLLLFVGIYYFRKTEAYFADLA
jgi:lipopolysaccharide transport system permease protein